MFSGGKRHRSRGAHERGKRPVGTDAGGDVFLRKFEEPEGLLGVALGGDSRGRLIAERSEIAFADLNAHHRWSGTEREGEKEKQKGEQAK